MMLVDAFQLSIFYGSMIYQGLFCLCVRVVVYVCSRECQREHWIFVWM